MARKEAGRPPDGTGAGPTQTRELPRTRDGRLHDTPETALIRAQRTKLAVSHPAATREIPLTKGLVAIVDEADYDFLSQFKWFALQTAKHAYAVCTTVIFVEGEPYAQMHRAIVRPRQDQVVHHINRDTLDNRRANLVALTPHEHLTLHAQLEAQS